ncbi:hypothetical protein C3K47_18955 [Solitalea longa]|uniref:Uncharacterized protein n=1 Tax=Solitalea longa TaxID=2079460 RepID=A0A2S4ZWG6_9SPHI|nr:hypothetical protein [Solitalea longa]POY34714.1 hypothetical protein C3K47_18955 [Solitalea longa]
MRLKTYSQKNSKSAFEFYLLSKGNNAGKPLENPCPNCFTCICKDDQEKEQLFTLCFGLWQGGYFLPFITGSVIPFIRLDDLSTVIKTAQIKINEKPLEFEQSVSVIKTLNQHSKIIESQVKLNKEAKKAMLYKLLR